ncbi:hypothetical protein [Photobacterium carnosum]|uniref:hypothetical protein n=1 Tax=Photobacterium carnosum TaxID=2023717 RepID=UPI001E5BCC62|nr:hypothetical protein [Photobacterium carnosum]MCD9526021.1 hypothetical protein [Photobacterium carnosum]
MILIVILLSLLILGYTFRYLLKNPVYGIYLSFFSSGILKTVNLGPLRDKFGLTEVIFLLTWLAMMLTNYWKNNRVKLNSIQKLTFVIMFTFIFIEWLSLLLNNMDFYGGLIGSIVEVTNLTYGALMALTLVVLISERPQFFMCLKFWILGALVVSIIGCWALTGTAPGWTMDDFTGRISSTLKFENQVPSYLIPIFIPMVMGLFVRGISSKNKIILLICSIMLAATMIGTGSRTALLLLVLAIFAIAFTGLITIKNNYLFKGKFLMGIACLIFALFSYVILALAAFDGHYALGHTPSWQRPVVRLYLTLDEGAMLDSTREEQLSIVDYNMDKAMIIGNGPKLYGRKYGMEEIHNSYVGVYFESGLLGISAFLTLLVLCYSCAFSAIKYIPNNGEKILIVSVIAGFSLLLFYSGTMYGLRQRNIWLMMGLLISLPSLYKRAKI